MYQVAEVTAMLNLDCRLLAFVDKPERPVFPVALDLIVVIFAANEGLGIQDVFMFVCHPILTHW